MKLTTQRLKKLVREELKKINESEDFENPLGIKPPPEMPKTRAQEDEEEAINMVIAYIAALLIGGYTAHLIQSDIEVAKKISEMPADEIEDIYKWLYDNIDLFGDEAKQESAILIIKQGLVDHTLVADPEINLAATLIRLSRMEWHIS